MRVLDYWVWRVATSRTRQTNTRSRTLVLKLAPRKNTHRLATVHA